MLAADRILQHRYRILELLGEGGMGAVYRAMDQRLDTVVALKECFFSEQHLRKQFEREAHLLARLRHPAMTRVIDHFTEEDGQFLVMEYIPGDDLRAMLKSRGSAFPPAQVRQWADQLLDALTYLHGQEPQIIHRDIKPQNLKMIGSAQIILLDFGLAKSLANEVAQLTSVSVLGYTPNYAPLEQIQGTGTDHRSDLYALGATLYHLITGIAPAAALARASALVSSQPDPLRPAHELNPEVPAPASAALMQAMALDRNGRFASAEQMRNALDSSADESTAPTIVERVSAEREVVASPVQHVSEPPLLPPPERPRRKLLIWVVLAILLCGVGVLIYVSAIGKSPGDRQAVSERQATMENASSSAVPAASSTSQLTLTGHTKEVKSVAFAPDGASVASGGSDGMLKLWDARTGAVRQTLPQGDGEIVSVIFSPDGKTLALAIDQNNGKGQVFLLDCTTWQQTKQFAVDNINSLAFSPDGRTLAVANISSSLNLWDVASGELKRTLEGQDIQTRSVAFSPDGKTIIGGGYGNSVKVWDAETGVLKRLLEGHQSEIVAVAFAPNGKTIASGSEDDSAKVWDSETGTVLRTLSGLKTGAVAIAFSPDGALLAVADGSSVKLWEPQSGTVKQTLAGGHAPVVAFAFSPDGKTLAIAAGATLTLREVSAVK